MVPGSCHHAVGFIFVCCLRGSMCVLRHTLWEKPLWRTALPLGMNKGSMGFETPNGTALVPAPRLASSVSRSRHPRLCMRSMTSVGRHGDSCWAKGAFAPLDRHAVGPSKSGVGAGPIGRPLPTRKDQDASGGPPV
jgi:hypothetical protein